MMNTVHSKTTPCKTALVTGACGGIGKVVAADLAKQGYQLLLVDMNADANQALADELQPANTSAKHQCITLDLTNRTALNQFCQTLQDIDLQLAFINAGVVHTGSVLEQTEAQIDQQLEVNLRSAIMINRACAQTMLAHNLNMNATDMNVADSTNAANANSAASIVNTANTASTKNTKQTHRHIINTVSLAAMVPLKNTATYSATKAGLRSFLIALQAELAAAGSSIAVSGIYPAAVDTPMLHYEARNGGNVLNFLSTPQTPQDVLRAFNKIQKTHALEIYVPYSDSILGRLVCIFPNTLHRFSGLLEKQGKKGQKKYLESLKRRNL